jgi:hypothetical protein
MSVADFSKRLAPAARSRLKARIEAELAGRERKARLAADYAYFAPECLKIRAKAGAITPFCFNRAQLFIHARLEEQRAKAGKVRALILKGRQQGCSTYVAGRFYHRAIHGRGLRVFILTHEDPATQNLFDMVDRFHAHCPGEVRPQTGHANAKELSFDALDSGYRVATAATKGAGRSSTIQLFHGSEVAFWPNADSHAAGVLQAGPDLPGTEFILESTANGIGNFFHVKWREADAGACDYAAIFVPWWWQDEYRKAPPENFALDPEETEYRRLYGLDLAQMAWRRAKVGELRDRALFKQEYPATAAEAFQMSGHDSFIPPALVARARKAACAPSGPLVIGFDQSAGWMKQVIEREKPRRVFVDVGGVGAGVYDRLCEMGFGEIVRPVNFGSSPMEPPPLDAHGQPSGGPVNRRAEMWLRSKEWLEDPAGAQIPDRDSLQADACGPTYSYDSHTRLILESKDKMRQRGVPSPDEWDAVALTFAEPVASDAGFARRLAYPEAGVV